MNKRLRVLGFLLLKAARFSAQERAQALARVTRGRYLGSRPVENNEELHEVHFHSKHIPALEEDFAFKGYKPIKVRQHRKSPYPATMWEDDNGNRIGYHSKNVDKNGMTRLYVRGKKYGAVREQMLDDFRRGKKLY